MRVSVLTLGGNEVAALSVEPACSVPELKRRLAEGIGITPPRQRLLHACRPAGSIGRSVSRPAGRSAGRAAGRTAGRPVGWSAGRSPASRPVGRRRCHTLSAGTLEEAGVEDGAELTLVLTEAGFIQREFAEHRCWSWCHVLGIGNVFPRLPSRRRMVGSPRPPNGRPRQAESMCRVTLLANTRICLLC